MFTALQQGNLDKEAEKLKMIIAIARRIEEKFVEKEKMTSHDQRALQGYCHHIEKLAIEDEIDVQHVKAALKIIDSEIEQVEQDLENIHISSNQ